MAHGILTRSEGDRVWARRRRAGTSYDRASGTAQIKAAPNAHARPTASVMHAPSSTRSYTRRREHHAHLAAALPRRRHVLARPRTRSLGAQDDEPALRLSEAVRQRALSSRPHTRYPSAR